MIKIYNSIVFRLQQLCDSILKYILLLKCRILNIRIDNSIRIYGMPYLSVTNGGTIDIGKNCCMRSRVTSNNIGLNHKCMIVSEPYCRGKQSHLSIGANCGFSGVSIWCSNSITIGDCVRVGANTLIMDGDAHYDDERTSPPKPIVIESDVFIGANCVIKKGVTIGRGALIGMNSVVTKDIPAYCVAVGSPAKVIRKLNDEK